MPLIGVVDPSHKEKARDTQGRLPKWLTLADALDAARDPRWSQWPWELLNAMFGSTRTGTTSRRPRSWTTACAPTSSSGRPTTSRTWTTSTSPSVARTCTALEVYAHPEAIAEARFYTTIDGETVSCSPDHLTRDTLTDWKFTENPPQYQYPWRNHTEQVQFNAFIVRNAHRWSGTASLRSTPPLARCPSTPRSSGRPTSWSYLGPKQVKALRVESKQEYVDGDRQQDGQGQAPGRVVRRQGAGYPEPRVAMFKEALRVWPDWPEGAEKLWGGEPGYTCPGSPLCRIPNCIAKRYPGRLTW